MQNLQENLQNEEIIVEISTWEKNIWYYIVKRFIDIVGSICGIVLLSPIMLITAVAVKLDSKGPIFFSQNRVGQHGRAFKMYKFRSMLIDT